MKKARNSGKAIFFYSEITSNLYCPNTACIVILMQYHIQCWFTNMIIVIKFCFRFSYGSRLVTIKDQPENDLIGRKFTEIRASEDSYYIG
jgi:hypothetical protein